jgi:SnoaL-like domain
MTWLTEFGQVVHEAAHLGKLETLEAAHAALHSGDPTRLIEAFPGGVTVDDPRAGRVEGQAALEDYCRESRAWLGERQAIARSLAVTNGAKRLVGEFEVDLIQDGRAFTLPVAVVVEPDAAGRAVWIRSYHSHWPLLGRHVIRSPLLPSDPDAVEADVVGEYQTALRSGDAAAWVGAFEPDGCFREPAGGEHRYCGTDALRELAAAFFARGGIILEHCTVTDDAVRTALEFNAVEWGGRRLPPQAGVAVYERGRTGRLAAARVYDDVDPPLG